MQNIALVLGNAQLTYTTPFLRLMNDIIPIVVIHSNPQRPHNNHKDYFSIFQCMSYAKKYSYYWTLVCINVAISLHALKGIHMHLRNL